MVFVTSRRPPNRRGPPGAASKACPSPLAVTSVSGGTKWNSVIVAAVAIARAILAQGPPWSILGAQALKAAGGFFKRGELLAESEADLLRAVLGVVVETRAGHDGDADFFYQVPGEGNVVLETEATCPSICTCVYRDRVKLTPLCRASA